jgi:thioredoxin-dependent peroxiredoxin
MRLIKPLALAVLLVAVPVLASLKPGDKAPDFTTEASLGGNVFSFSLAEALKQGPVVLYFYPKAFTKGCTVEAHEFSEATDQFKALGATVVGISHDNIDTLKDFSVKECRNKFAVAADPDSKIIKSYDTVLTDHPDYADRTSYVITPDGRIAYAYSDMDPSKHVANTMTAVKKWKDQQKQ